MAPLLELQNISVYRGDRLALDGVSLSVASGEHVVILGPNGSGKSTLIKTLTRECYPLQKDGSFIRILGRDNWNVFSLRALLGIVSNDLMAAYTRPITGREAVLSGFFSSVGVWPWHEVTPEMERKTDEVLSLLEIEHLAGRDLIEMSSGEARRILIGRALVHNPRTLLLDEPANSLDPGAFRELREVLRKLARAGIGLLLVTHHLPDIIPEIERVILLREGKVAGDGPKQELLTSRTLTDLFGAPVELLERDGFYQLW